jgi:hypothetical protein
VRVSYHVQARTACAASVKERDALYTELHSLGATFRAKHDKLQEQVGAGLCCRKLGSRGSCLGFAFS